MSETTIQSHLQALNEYVNQARSGAGGLQEIRIKKKQLSAIQRTIRQLEKNSVPVPESISNEKLSLISEINNLEGTSDGCLHVYESLIQTIFELGRVCNKLPHKDLYRLSRQWRQEATPQPVLRKAILKALQDLGDAGSESQVLDHIQKQLAGKLTPADLARPGGKNIKWQNNVRRERRAMVKEGLLTKDSKGKTWTLAQ